MHAMILAAGRGERLRPLTDTIPKPLIEVGGKALIEHHLLALAGAGISRVVINLGWLGEQISSRLEDGAGFGLEIVYSPEPPGALETAGGIVQALPLLGEQPFLGIAGDILCDFPLGRLSALPADALAHLVMVANPAHHRDGDFALDQGWLRVDGTPRHTFSGIGLYRPELFHGLAPGRLALRPVFEQAIAAGAVCGSLHRGYWSDIGTIERLEQARREPAAINPARVQHDH
ncbi:MAG: nucleotidyltransferase family protein [Wenzhouxiangella sp.]|nr:nucleotidyltransferase family protein [Wenzhouxiangella sp.]